MTNLGQHSLDVVHWITGVKGANAVTSAGGRYFLEDNGEVPDTQDVMIEYPGFRAVCQWRECAAGVAATGMGGLEFHGTKGTLVLGRDGFEIFPDKKENPTNIVARIIGGHPGGAPRPVAEPAGQCWPGPADGTTARVKDQEVRPARHCLDCVHT